MAFVYNVYYLTKTYIQNQGDVIGEVGNTGKSSYGDDPVDQSYIREGINWYDENY